MIEKHMKCFFFTRLIFGRSDYRMEIECLVMGEKKVILLGEICIFFLRL